MDPITVLLSALALAGSAAQPVTDQAIKDSYAGLKALIVRKFGASHPKLEPTLADYADDPETYEKPAAKVLREAGLDRDQEVLERAAELLKRASAGAAGSVTVTASGERSVAIGGGMSGSTIITGDQPKARPSA
jgi:hypothetical protein